MTVGTFVGTLLQHEYKRIHIVDPFEQVAAICQRNEGVYVRLQWPLGVHDDRTKSLSLVAVAAMVSCSPKMQVS